MQPRRSDHEPGLRDDYITIEEVGDDGEVVICFAGYHRVRLAVPTALVPHYKTLLQKGLGPDVPRGTAPVRDLGDQRAAAT